MQISKRKRRVIYGVSVDAIGTIFAMLVGILVVPYFFLYISKEQYGAWLAVNALVALISLVDMGTDQYLTTIVADDEKFHSENIGHVILSSLILKSLIAIIICVAGFILYALIPLVLVIDPPLLNVVRQTFLICLGSLIFTMFASTVSVILFGRHHFSIINFLVSLSAILGSSGTIVFLSLGLNIKAFPLALLSSSLIQFIVLFLFLIKTYPHIKLRIKGFVFHNKKEMVAYSTSFQLLRWAHTIRSQYIVIAINNLISPNAAALYNLTNRLPQMIPLFASKVASPLFPSFSEFFAKGNIKLASSTFLKISKLLFRLSFFSAIVIFVVGKAFVSLWVGSSNFAGMNILFLLTLSAFIFSAMGVFGIVIFASKKFEKWVFWSVLEILIAVFLSYILSINFGFFGVVFGMVVASMITPLYLLAIALRQLNLTFSNFLKSVVLYALFANISTVLFAVVVINFIEMSDWGQLISICVSFAIIHMLSYEGLLMFRSKEISFKAKLIAVVKL